MLIALCIALAVLFVICGLDGRLLVSILPWVAAIEIAARLLFFYRTGRKKLMRDVTGKDENPFVMLFSYNRGKKKNGQ